jgi:hypothetical protein
VSDAAFPLWVTGLGQDKNVISVQKGPGDLILGQNIVDNKARDEIEFLSGRQAECFFIFSLF